MNRHRAVFLWEGQASGVREAHNKEGGGAVKRAALDRLRSVLGKNGWNFKVWLVIDGHLSATAAGF